MGKTKKIQIKAEFLTQEGGKRKKKVKPKINNLIKPNKVKRALMKRIAEHQQQQKQNKQVEKKQAVFKTDFKDTLSYLNSVVKNKTLKQEKKKRRRERKRKEIKKKNQEKISVTTYISQKDDPPYGILKGGKKQLFSEYKKTLRHKGRRATFSPITFPENNSSNNSSDNPSTKSSVAIIERKMKLQKLREKVQTPRTLRKKRYTLGKRGRKIGIMIQGKKTRKKIKREHDALKTKDFHEIKLYLKRHGLIKVGSAAPESILRAIYETSILSGDIYNKNNNVFLHNYINAESN